MKLFVNGKEAVAGMKVQTFRGEEAILLDWYEPGTRSGGNGGRVYLKINDTKMEYFPSIINANLQNEPKRPIGRP